jgi:hypothetical protein
VKKNYKSAFQDLIRFKKYAPPSHPERVRVEKLLEKIKQHLDPQDF